MTHIGKKIEEIVRERKLTIVGLAREINTTRNNIYNIFGRESIDTKLLLKIGKLVQFDFFDYISKNDLALHLTENPSLEEIANDGPLNYSATPLKIEEYKKKIVTLEFENKLLKKRLKEKEEIMKH